MERQRIDFYFKVQPRVKTVNKVLKTTKQMRAQNARQQTLILYTNKAKGAPTLGLPAVYGGWGRKQINAKRRLNTKAYRMPQLLHDEDSGGTGLDEMVSTETVATIVEILGSKKATLDHIKDVTEFLSREREEVRFLVWTTDDEARPLAGHPGSLSKSQRDMRRGLTALHGDKNIIRANWVLNEYRKNTGNESQQLIDTSIMASVMTNQLFSEPFAQTDLIAPTSQTIIAYHPKHGKLYVSKKGIVSKTQAYRKVIVDAHNARERRKWQTAERLLNRGYTNLVHPDMTKWILQGNGWQNGLELYLMSIGGKQPSDSGPAQSSAYVPLKTAGPRTLAQWNNDVSLGIMPTAVGAPRPLLTYCTIKFEFSQPMNQTTLLSFNFPNQTPPSVGNSMVIDDK